MTLILNGDRPLATVPRARLAGLVLATATVLCAGTAARGEDGLGTALRSAVQTHPLVKSKLAELEVLGLRVEEAQGQVLQAVRETLDSFMRQYDAGRKTWVDVLNTQRELSDASQQLESARTSWFELTLRSAALLGLLDEMAGLHP